MSGTPGRRAVYAQLWAHVLRYRARTAAALVLLVAAKLAAVGVPLVLKAIVDRLSAPQGEAPAAGGALPAGALIVVAPAGLLLGYAALRFVSTLFTELRDLVFARVTRHVATAFSQRSFAHLLALDPRFHTRRNTGMLIRDVERGTAGIAFLLGAGLFTILPTLIELLAVLGVMAAGYDLAFAGVIVVAFAVYAAYTTVLTQRREVRQRKVNEMDSRAHGRIVDTLLNYESVKTFARERYEDRRYGEICDVWIDSSVRNQRALSLLHVGQSSIIACGVAAVMLLAGERTVRGAMTVGDLVLVNTYVIQICMPLNALGFVFREARDAFVNIEKLLELLGQRPGVAERAGAPPLAVQGGVVQFDGVAFAYEPGRPILADVSFTIGAGETTAVVGGSGSGKSTLARLLLRLYDVDAGVLRIDGQDVRDVKLESLRDAIGVVPQDTVLFNDTIAYNIGYGRIGAGAAEIVAAAQSAQVHEFVMSLPEQYDTVVGERGVKLSGGEKQRIAIARAFLKNPPIMIFDEATSALDTRAERAIQRQLDEIAQGRTTLIIAHRLSTIVDADQILVMDRGRVVERGRHDALLAADGLYAQLWQLQRQQQQVERLERALVRQPVNLAVLVADAVDALHDEVERRRVRLHADIDLAHAGVVGDPSTLAQAVRDVCVWALQATPLDGSVQLQLVRDGDRARLSVTDGRRAAATASAAPHELVPFDPLAVRSTIERQGGRFDVEMPTSTHGMRYRIELPLRSSEPALPMA